MTDPLRAFCIALPDPALARTVSESDAFRLVRRLDRDGIRVSFYDSGSLFYAVREGGGSGDAGEGESFVVASDSEAMAEHAYLRMLDALTRPPEPG